MVIATYLKYESLLFQMAEPKANKVGCRLLQAQVLVQSFLNVAKLRSTVWKDGFV